MTDEEQFAIINTRDWYTAMRQQAGRIFKAMGDNEFSADGWVETIVNGIKVMLDVEGQDIHARVGQKSSGDWMYDWKFPIGWVTT